MEFLLNILKVVLVLSQQYTASHWCMFEAHMSQHRLVQVRKRLFGELYYTAALRTTGRAWCWWSWRSWRRGGWPRRWSTSSPPWPIWLGLQLVGIQDSRFWWSNGRKLFNDPRMINWLWGTKCVNFFTSLWWFFPGSAEQADFWRKLVVTLAKKSNSFSIEVSILFKMLLFGISAIFAILLHFSGKGHCLFHIVCQHRIWHQLKKLSTKNSSRSKKLQ